MSIEVFRANNAIESAKYRQLVTNKWLFNLFLFKSLPMGFLAGLRVVHFDEEKCSISVPYRWLNQNPFRSTYFAVLAMAAEMSSGMIALMHTNNSKPSVSMLVTGLEASFIKKATGITTFTCADGHALKEAIERCIATGESQNVYLHFYRAIGLGRNGGEVFGAVVV